MKKLFVPLMLIMALLVSFDAISSPILNSLPSAHATIYLDFDGYYVNSPDWNSGIPFQCNAAGMTDAQITEIFSRVSEDYRPFNLNITTDSTVFLAAPATQRIRVVVTPTSAWFPGVGGITFVGSFTWGDETPCFVFCNLLGPNNPKMVAECCSHESGHSLGLYHQSTWDSTCNLTAVYSIGDGSGEVGWAPIMGDSYYQNMTGWYNGLTPYACTMSQDNLSIITTQNGFSYRADDYSDDINTNPATLDVFGTNANGIITTSTDKDAFKFTMANSSGIHLSAMPYSVGANDDGADLDIQLQLFDAQKNLLRTYNPAGTMDVTVDTTLPAGDYYLLISGAGNPYVSNYGSIGSYTLSALSVILPIQGVSLIGKTDGDKHDLNWSITNSEAIKSIVLEYSTDGKNFSSLNAMPSTSASFTYTPFAAGDIYYRLKVSSVSGQSIYSNTILLKANSGLNKLFTVSTLAHTEITVNAPENFLYSLHTINGSTIVIGKGKQGVNEIRINNQPNGIYILQLIANNQQQIERIIKQ